MKSSLRDDQPIKGITCPPMPFRLVYDGREVGGADHKLDSSLEHIDHCRGRLGHATDFKQVCSSRRTIGEIRSVSARRIAAAAASLSIAGAAWSHATTCVSR